MIKVFSIYDGKLRIFMRPFFEQHTGAALRAFELACKQAESPFAQFPADFVLYEIGTFNEDSGELVSYSPKIQIAAAVDYVGQAKPISPSAVLPKKREAQSEARHG